MILRRSKIHQSRDRAFTLVELLVVIAIIVLLAGILFPLASTAIAQSRQITCASNMRQWGMAVMIYAVDNNGYLPRRGQGVQPTRNITRPEDWFNALPPKLGMKPYMAMAASGEIPAPGTPGGSALPGAVRGAAGLAC